MSGHKHLGPNGSTNRNSLIDKDTLSRSENNAPQVTGFLSRGDKDRYLLSEGRETPGEIKASKKTPGMGMIADKNRMGVSYAWLIYNFAVSEAKLKKGHRQYLQKILSKLLTYGRLHNKTGTILLSGHASPSGVHGKNTKLAYERARSVRNELVKMGPVSTESLPKDWFLIKNERNASKIYSVTKAPPTSPWQRSLSRSVYIVLWLMQDIETPDLFPRSLRVKIRKQVPNRFQKYEEYFYYWVIDNWEYLRNPNNNYVIETYPHKDGLFFIEPRSQLKTDKMAWSYLKSLHTRFEKAAHRLTHKYTGIPGNAFLPSGGDPVRCYQQLARWIALDGHARNGNERVFHFMPGTAIYKSFNTLIEMINSGSKFGDKKVIWKKIEVYMKEKRIPMRVAKTPEK